MNTIGVARLALWIERLQLRFNFVQRRGIEQFAQVALAQQLLQLRLINGQSLSAPLCQWSIALVDVVRNVRKQQRRGERRGLRRVDGRHSHLPELILRNNATVAAMSNTSRITSR